MDIKGRIIDDSTNEPIPYATIYVDGTTNGIRMGTIKDIHEWAKDSPYIIVSGQAGKDTALMNMEASVLFFLVSDSVQVITK